MSMTRTNSSEILSPAEVAELVTAPALAASVAAQVAKVIQTSASSIRIPIVDSFATSAFVLEGEEIPVSQSALSEIVIEFSKAASLVPISSELASDSTPEATAMVGAGLAQDIANRMDIAYFGTTSANGPSGIGSLSGVQTVDAGAAWANTDWALEAISLIETAGQRPGAFVCSPATALALAKIKTATGSNAHLLQPDPASPTGRVVSGVPLFVTTAVDANIVYALPFEQTFVGMRQEISVIADHSAYFTSDRVALRATCRYGFGFPLPGAIVKVATTL